MGISIHYSGKINKAADIGVMTNELADISRELKWTFTLIDDVEQQVKGIIIKPHKKSEPLAILLNKNRQLINLFALSLNEVNEESAKFASIKTQFAPIHIHISIVKLLKYLKQKYIGNLRVIDEGDYWETMDETILKEKIDFLASKIDLLSDILNAQQNDIADAGTPEELAKKLEAIFKRLTSKK